MSKVLQLSRSGYYRWFSLRKKLIEKQNRLNRAVLESRIESHKLYGSHRIATVQFTGLFLLLSSLAPGELKAIKPPPPPPPSRFGPRTLIITPQHHMKRYTRRMERLLAKPINGTSKMSRNQKLEIFRRFRNMETGDEKFTSEQSAKITKNLAKEVRLSKKSKAILKKVIENDYTTGVVLQELSSFIRDKEFPSSIVEDIVQYIEQEMPELIRLANHKEFFTSSKAKRELIGKRRELYDRVKSAFEIIDVSLDAPYENITTSEANHSGQNSIPKFNSKESRTIVERLEKNAGTLEDGLRRDLIEVIERDYDIGEALKYLADFTKDNYIPLVYLGEILLYVQEKLMPLVRENNINHSDTIASEKLKLSQVINETLKEQGSEVLDAMVDKRLMQEEMTLSNNESNTAFSQNFTSEQRQDIVINLALWYRLNSKSKNKTMEISEKWQEELKEVIQHHPEIGAALARLSELAENQDISSPLLYEIIYYIRSEVLALIRVTQKYEHPQIVLLANQALKEEQLTVNRLIDEVLKGQSDILTALREKRVAKLKINPENQTTSSGQKQLTQQFTPEQSREIIEELARQVNMTEDLKKDFQKAIQNDYELGGVLRYLANFIKDNEVPSHEVRNILIYIQENMIDFIRVAAPNRHNPHMRLVVAVKTALLEHHLKLAQMVENIAFSTLPPKIKSLINALFSSSHFFKLKRSNIIKVIRGYPEIERLLQDFPLHPTLTNENIAQIAYIMGEIEIISEQHNIKVGGSNFSEVMRYLVQS